ncbi:MAG UNVERIFIED_CONTAM: hypothetical protein LVR29_31830 [Microcystis novacekii LVE1205-3]|jgi:hypothetical protein
MTETFIIPAMGWLPDYPDIRDVTFQSEARTVQTASFGTTICQANAGPSGSNDIWPAALPASVDLRAWCSPMEDQKNYRFLYGPRRCRTGVSILSGELLANTLDAFQPLSLQSDAQLAQMDGRYGAFLRSTMYALTLFGVPPEEYYPYNIADFDKEPSAFCYAFAQSYQAISYYRLDPPGTARDDC